MSAFAHLLKMDGETGYQKIYQNLEESAQSDEMANDFTEWEVDGLSPEENIFLKRQIKKTVNQKKKKKKYKGKMRGGCTECKRLNVITPKSILEVC